MNKPPINAKHRFISYGKGNKKEGAREAAAIFTKNKSYYKELALLALPITGQNLVVFLTDLIDDIIVSPLGDAALSGVSIGNRVQALMTFMLCGAEGVMLLLGSQYLGSGDRERQRGITVIGGSTCLAIGALFCAASLIFPRQIVTIFAESAEIVDTGAIYLSLTALSFIPYALSRALVMALRIGGSPRVGLYASAVALAVTATADNTLVEGAVLFGGSAIIPPLGIRGAALATLLGRLAESITVIAFIIAKYLCARKRGNKSPVRPRFGGAMLRDILRYGSPIVAGQLLWAADSLFVSAIMGKADTGAAVAPFSIATAANNLMFVGFNAMAGAAGIIIGRAAGAGEKRKVRDYARTSEVLVLLLGLITGVAMLLLRRPFVSLYSTSQSTSGDAAELILVLSLLSPVAAYQTCTLGGILKNGGDTAFVLLTEAVCAFAVLLPLGLCVPKLGAAPYLVLAALKADQLPKCIAAFLRLRGTDKHGEPRWIKALAHRQKSADNSRI